MQRQDKRRGDRDERVIIRPARVEDSSSIARVHVDSWRTTYRGIVPQAYLDGLSYGAREQWWREGLARVADRSLGLFTLVAESEAGQIVGFAGGGPVRHDHGDYRPFDGELQAVYLLQQEQGRGVGTQLVREVAGLLRTDGRRSMMLWALEGNPACRFYGRLGGVVVFRREVPVSGALLPEVAYGWPDIERLVAP